MAVHVILSERDVRKEMAKSLGEWGVFRETSKEHAKFIDYAMKIALQYARPEPSWNEPLWDRIEGLRANQLPRNPVDAIRHVLAHELKDLERNKVFVVADEFLDMKYSPFYQRKNKRTGQLEYNTRLEFKKISPEELDPLTRFVKKELTPKEYFYKQWNIPPLLAGTVFEAVVACHVVHSEACKNCFGKNFLRWNGGRDAVSSWADVICVQCKSTYEIKSQASADAIEKKRNYKSIPGGSFRTFYKYSTFEDSKRYLVIVNRQADYQRGSNSMTHAVFIGEIDRVLPKLCQESFIGSQDYIRITSEIVTKKDTYKPWCRVPSFQIDDVEMAKQNVEMAKEVFEERFGNGSWDEIAKQKRAILNPKTRASPPSDLKPKPLQETKALFLASFDNLKCADGDSDGDWDTIYKD